MEKKQMTYSELVNHVESHKYRVESHKYRMNRWDVASWLIGYQKVMTETDWENIMRLYDDNFID